MSKSSLVWLAVVACAFLGGCSVGATKVSGKVIRGDLSFILVVDASDERLKADGLPGAQVQMHQGADRGGKLVGEVTSDEKGNFVIPVKETAAILRAVELSATKEGYARSMGEMSIPPVSQRILVILKPSPGGTR
jgi:hypothetical protein